MGCRPPNLEAVAQAVFAQRTTTAKLIIADLKKKRRVKALLRSGGVTCVRILLLRVSETLNRLQAIERRLKVLMQSSLRNYDGENCVST